MTYKNPLANIGKKKESDAKIDESKVNEQAAKVESGQAADAAFGNTGLTDQNNPLQTGGQVESLNAKAAAASDDGAAKSIDLESEQLAKEQLAEESTAVASVYTSHPIRNYKVGRWQFTNGTLTLGADEAAEFDSFLDKAGGRIRQTVKKIDVNAANSLSEQFQKNQLLRGVDTTSNSHL